MLSKLRKLLVFFLLPLASCAMFGGHLPIYVKGEFVDRTTKAPLRCKLMIEHADDSRPANDHWREIEGPFIESYFTSPGQRSYAVDAICEGREFHSEVQWLGGRSEARRIDLGVVEL